VNYQRSIEILQRQYDRETDATAKAAKKAELEECESACNVQLRAYRGHKSFQAAAPAMINLTAPCGVTMRHLERFPEALADFDRANQLREGDLDTLCNRACILAILGHLPEALEQLRAVIARDPKYRAIARDDDDFAKLKADPHLGPEFEKLMTEPVVAG
jgi:tetratricopeptide (TPR) repeat protein